MKKRSRRSNPSRKKMNKKYSRRNRLFRKNRLSRRKLKGGEGGEGTPDENISYKLKYPFSEHTDKIDWTALSHNPNAIHLLEQNLDKEVDWGYLSRNPNAIHILEQNLDKVDWSIIWSNPSIFEEEIPYLLK
jgi:hypothetical protein